MIIEKIRQQLSIVFVFHANINFHFQGVIIQQMSLALSLKRPTWPPG